MGRPSIGVTLLSANDNRRQQQHSHTHSILDLGDPREYENKRDAALASTDDKTTTIHDHPLCVHMYVTMRVNAELIHVVRSAMEQMSVKKVGKYIFQINANRKQRRFTADTQPIY